LLLVLRLYPVATGVGLAGEPLPGRSMHELTVAIFKTPNAGKACGTES